MAVSRHRYAVEGWGVGELWTADGVVVEHAFTAGAAGAHVPEGTPRSPESIVARPGARDRDDFAPEVIRRIHRLLGGEAEDLADVPIDLDWCTPFQRAAIETLRELPRGDVVTYGELAALAGAPGAARAAGSVCAANRFWLFVPCHRVVAATGIGGYGPSGVALKRRLLELEGVDVDAL